MSIERFVGIVETGLVHPFIEGAVIQDGLDQWGCDWSGVDRTLMKAVLWARRTQHKLFPKSVDPIDGYDLLTATPVSRRWAAIQDDYYHAVEREESAAISITLVAERGTSDPSGVTNGFGALLRAIGEARKTQTVNPETFVREASLGNVTVLGADRVVTGVYDTLVASGSDLVFRNVVVLTSAIITGSDISGSVYLAPGATIQCTGSDMRMHQQRRTWQQLAIMIAG